jgi:type II secretory pathway pseudopilin PulG
MSKKHSTEKTEGFTLLEVVVVIFTVAVLSLVSLGSIALFQKKTELSNTAQEFANVLRLAQSKTVASDNTSQYGVYINAALSPDQYVLFKGASYAARITAFDVVHVLPKTVEFSQLSLGADTEIVFEKLSGFAVQSGSVTLGLVQDTSQTTTIYITPSGAIDFTPPQNASDSARVKDSRHLHFDYSRNINTATENIVLTFNGSVVQTIPIASHLVAGQFYWQGTVTVGALTQTVTVQTHRLNSTDTQFSVHRDRSLNDTTLAVTLSGDASGNLVLYSADGTTTTSSSIYVSNLVWQ